MPTSRAAPGDDTWPEGSMSDEIEGPSLGAPYLPLRLRTTQVEHVEQEAVGRGISAAVAAVLGGIVLIVVIRRYAFEFPVAAAALSGGAVLLYARSAGRAPRRGLVPLLILLVGATVLSFYAVFATDGWMAYDVVSEGMTSHGFTWPVSRSTYILRAAWNPGMIEGYRDVLLQVTACAVGGAVPAMWWVRRAAR
jgi:hypothetical protein